MPDPIKIRWSKKVTDVAERTADSIATASFDDDDLAGNTQPALFSLIDSDPGHDVATARVHEEEFQGECIVKLPPPSLATWYPPLWYWEKLLPKDVPELHSNEIFSRGKTPDFPRNGFLSSFFIKFPGIDRCTKVLRSKRVTDKAVQTAESTGITNTSSKDGNLSENTQPGLVSLMDSDFGLGGSSFVDYSGLEEHADRGHFPFADSEDLVQLATTRQPNIYSLNDLLGLSFSPVKTTANADVESGVPIKLLDFVIDAERAEKDVTDVSTAHPAVPLKSEDATSRKLLGYPSPRNTDKKRLSRKDALLSLAEHDFALTERNVNLQKDEELAEKYDDNNDVRQENQKPTTISEAESTKTSETSRIQYTADELRALEPSIQTKLFIPYELRDFLVPQSTAPKAPQREGHLAQFDVERSMKARIGMKASTHASDDDDAAAGAVMDSGKPSFKNQFSGSTLGRSDNTSWTPTVWGDTDTAPPQLSTSMAVLEPELKVEVPVAKPPPSTAKGIQASFWASSDENEKPKPATIVPKAEAEVTLPAMGVAMKSEPKPVVVKKGIMDSIWASGSDGDKLKRSATVEATVEVGTPKAEVKVPTPKSALTLIHSHIASNQSPPAYIVPKVSTSPFQPQTYVVPNLDPHPSSFTDTATALRHYALTGQYLTHEDLTYIFGQLTVRSAGSVTALPTSAAFESVVKKSKAISIVDLKTYKPVNTITGPVRIASGLSPAAPVFRPLAQPFTPSTPVLSPAAPVFTPAIPPRTSSEYAITTPQAMNLEPKKPEHRITITVRGVPGMQLVDYAVLSEDQFIVTDALIQLRSRASAREFFSGK